MRNKFLNECFFLVRVGGFGGGGEWKVRGGFFGGGVEFGVEVVMPNSSLRRRLRGNKRRSIDDVGESVWMAIRFFLREGNE